jgi:hypothetical protein
MTFKNKDFEKNSENKFHSKYRSISTTNNNNFTSEKLLDNKGNEVKDINNLTKLNRNKKDLNDLSPELLADIDSGVPPTFNNGPNTFWSVPIEFTKQLLINNFILDVNNTYIGTDFKILYRKINTPGDINDDLPNDSTLFTLLQQGTISSDPVSVIINKKFIAGLYEFRIIGAFVDGGALDFNYIISSDENVKIYGGKWINAGIYTPVFTINYDLGCSAINQSTILTQADLPTDDACWPILINGGTQENPVTITLGEDIVLTGPNRYFIIESEYVNFDGANKNVTIKDINNYNGLFNNGDASNNGFSNVNITNINIKADNSTLTNSSGWVVQQNFAKAATNVVIDNCSSNGDLTNLNNAGIAGDNLAINGGEVIVRNCHTTGIIYGASHGLISNNCGRNGYVLIENCYTTGNILSSFSAGLVGDLCASNNGTVKINNCFTTGNISGRLCQGLVGRFIGSGSSTISTGGLYITNSYTLGNVTNITGEENEACSGFIGIPTTLSDGSFYQNIYISNVYVAGKIDKNSYAIVPPSIEKTLPFYSFYYAANGNWNDCEANKRLDPDTIPNKANNNIWIDINKHSNNVPYRLGSFNNFAYIYNKNNYFLDNKVLNNTKFNISYYNTNLVENQKYTLKYDVKVIDCVKPSCNLLNYNCIGFKKTGNKLLTIETNEYPIKYIDIEILKNNKINKSMKFKQSDIEKYSWPVYVNNNDKCKKLLLQLDSNLTLEGQDKYFIINGNNIKVDGKGYDIIIKDTLGYQGIFRNINNSNITIENIKTSSEGLSSLGRYTGVTGQIFFGNGVNNKNNTVNNIMNDMVIDNEFCGGVLGSNSKATVTNCSNSGDITGIDAGGVLGAFSVATITNCSNSGDMTGISAGGIVSSDCDVIVDNCINNGNFLSGQNGGITGPSTGGIITNCINNGSIQSNDDCGGITGVVCGETTGSIIIKNCVNNGSMTNGSFGHGGIAGFLAGRQATMLIEDCINNGSMSDFGHGGIAGAGVNNISGSTIIKRCINNGLIDSSTQGVSGITGYLTNIGGNDLTIEDCENYGNINGTNCGGITGYLTVGEINILKCYNKGIINGSNCGGIAAPSLGIDDPYGNNLGNKINIDNCYSKSLITNTNSNGLIAPILGNVYQNINVNNCYTLNGAISSDSANPLVTITNSYEPMGTWNDTDASDNLVGGPIPPSLVGEVWTDPSGTTTDTPWNLTNNPE